MSLKQWEGFLPPRGVVMGRPTTRQIPDEAHEKPAAASLPRVLFVGDGLQEAMVSQLLGKMIEAMGLHEDEAAITANLPTVSSDNSPLPHPLPQIIIALGEPATQSLLESPAPLSELRGRFHDFRGAKLMPTFHPSHLLTHPAAKRDAWADLQLVIRELKRS